MNERTKRTLANVVIAVIMLVITSIAGLFMVTSRQPEEVPVRNEPPTPVAVWRVAPTNIRDVITVPGVVVAWEDVSVAAEQAGRITELTFDRGDRVTTNSLLLQIDDRFQQQAVKRAQLDLREAERDLARWNELRKTGSVSQKELDDLSFRSEQAEVVLQQAHTLLAKCRVLSPIAGVVQERHVEQGEYLSPGTPVARIVSTSRVKVVVEVSEADVCRLRVGQRQSFSVDALQGRTFSGEIRYIASAGSLGSNTFRVDLAVDNSSDDLRPGYIARVSLVRGRYENAVVVPLDVLVPRQGLYLAFVVKDGSAVRRIVRPAAIVDSSAVVASGLAQGDCVVVDGQRSLADGMPVIVAEERK